jgi:hypothetical protein
LLLASRFFLKHDERRCLHLFVLSLFSPAGLSCAYGSVSCASVNEAFIACKKRDKDPAACLAAGDAVTSCVAGL